jgi:hypothetical protein
MRILPVSENGALLYLIRNQEGTEMIVRQHEIWRA